MTNALQYNTVSYFHSFECLCLSQQSPGERQGTTWTGCQYMVLPIIYLFVCLVILTWGLGVISLEHPVTLLTQLFILLRVAVDLRSVSGTLRECDRNAFWIHHSIHMLMPQTLRKPWGTPEEHKEKMWHFVSQNEVIFTSCIEQQSLASFQ